MSGPKVVPFDKPDTPDPPEQKTDGLLLSSKDPRASARAWLCRTNASDRLRFADGQFYLWDSPAYRLLARAELDALVSGFLDTAQKYASANSPLIVPFAPTTYDVREVREALGHLCYTSAQFPAWLDQRALDPSDCVLCANGVLHIPTLELIPPTAQYFFPSALTFAYTPDAPTPVRWLRFLDTLWPDEPEPIALLQEWMGYLLTPDTRQQKIFLMVGPRRAGKGTIFRVMRQLLGAHNTCSPTLTTMSTHFGRAALIGKTAAMFPDARVSGRSDTVAITESLLSISGEDAQSIPRKNLPDWGGTLTARITIGTGELPRLDDAAGALVSRYLILPMRESFLGREDLALGDALTAELPGILLWCLDGWCRLRARGRFLALPAAEQMRQDLEDLTSPIHAFLRDVCDIGPAYRVTVDDLYDAWKQWCEDNGRDKPSTKQVLGKNLRAAYPSVIEARPRDGAARTRYYEGVRTKPVIL